MAIRVFAQFIIALFLFGCNASVAQPTSQDQMTFTRDFERILKEKHSKISSHVEGPLTIKIKTEDGEEYQVNLDRIYTYCSHADSNACETAKSEFADRAYIRSDFAPKMDANSLRQIVRDQNYINAIEAARGNNQKVQSYYRKIGDDLFAVLAADSSEHIALVTPKLLADLKLNEDQAWALAYKQTVNILPPMPNAESLAVEPKMYEADEYLASLLIRTDEWQKLANKVGADLLVAAPTDQFVLAGQLQSGEQLEALKESAKQDCNNAQRCVSPHVYRFVNGMWRVAQ